MGLVIDITLSSKPVKRKYESIGRATGAGYFWGFMSSLLCPPFFGYLVDTTGLYAYSWQFLAGCAAMAIFLLTLYKEPGKK